MKTLRDYMRESFEFMGWKLEKSNDKADCFVKYFGDKYEAYVPYAEDPEFSMQHLVFTCSFSDDFGDNIIREHAIGCVRHAIFDYNFDKDKVEDKGRVMLMDEGRLLVTF